MALVLVIASDHRALACASLADGRECGCFGMRSNAECLPLGQGGCPVAPVCSSFLFDRPPAKLEQPCPPAQRLDDPFPPGAEIPPSPDRIVAGLLDLFSPFQGASWPIPAATLLASAPRLAARGSEREWAGPDDATERTRTTLISGPAPSLDRGEDRSSKRGDLPHAASRRGNESHNSAPRPPSDTANRADLGTHVAPREVARP